VLIPLNVKGGGELSRAFDYFWRGSQLEDTAAFVGEPAIDQLFSQAYGELRRLAAAVNRSNGPRTLNPTALVNEAWIKMASSPDLRFQDVLHFKRVAARAMRQVLVDYARRSLSQKRGGDHLLLFVTFKEEMASTVSVGADVLGLDDALNELARKDARQAQVVESRFFGGMEVSEIAAMLQISESTVHREWRFARAWLSSQMRTSLRTSAE
jgi:RNA polymerase sigma factor (TIGR02999 family)